jgi:hypothetical protein
MNVQPTYRLLYDTHHFESDLVWTASLKEIFYTDTVRNFRNFLKWSLNSFHNPYQLTLINPIFDALYFRIRFVVQPIWNHSVTLWKNIFTHPVLLISSIIGGGS